MFKKVLYSRWTLPLFVPLGVVCVVAYVWIAGTARPVAGAAQQTAAPARPARVRQTRVLYLAPPRVVAPDPSRPFPSLLSRELARQSLLLAAREELGLTTRDGVLGEPPPAGASAADAMLRLDVDNLKAHALPYRIVDVGGNEQQLAEDEVPIPAPTPTLPDMPRMVQDLEARSRGQYVDLLKREGFVRPGASAAATTEPTTRPTEPGDVEPQLAEMTEIAQFAAIRQAHAAIRSSGESADWLGVLVRGYANLGQLTAFHWSASHDVFVARSLLYAQRMVATEPNSANAHWHRAYAMALAGLHRAALADLASASKLPHKQAAPSWVELLEPLCRYRTEKLAALAAADKARAPLAIYLCYLTVEHCGSPSVVLETAKAALELNPLCMRLVDGMCRHAGVSYLHTLTQMGPALFRSSLPALLSRIKDLPAGTRSRLPVARTQWQDPAVVAALCKSLVEAPDADEFSWSALGRMLQEINFVHVETRTEFLAIQLGAEPEPFARQSASLIEGHPFKPFIDALACYSSGNPDRTKMMQALKGFNIPVLRQVVMPAIRVTMTVDTPGTLQGNAAWNSLWQCIDNTAWNQEERADAQTMTYNWDRRPEVYQWIARVVDSVSPGAPVAIAVHIVCDWKNAQKNVTKWTRQFPAYPIVNGALAWQYTRLKEYDKAEPFFRAYLKKAPDAWAYRMLADNYRLQGDRKNWLATIDESLKQEDYGLDHAYTQTEVANRLMDEGDYKTALPYADAAAQSYMSLGLKAAARCHEGLGEWDQAEAWVRADAERYDHPMDYYCWCVRTGHGDRATAGRAAQQWVESSGNTFDIAQMEYRLSFYLLDGQRDAALKAARQMVAVSDEPWMGIHLALLDIEGHDAAAAEAALDVVEKRGPSYKVPWTGRTRPQMIEVARLLRECLAAGPAGKLDLQAVDRAMAGIDPEEQANICYFVARFLQLRDKSAEAQPYFKRAARGSALDTNTLLAIQTLRASPATTRPADAQ
jgi:tetratricopeptide (TPR) repeat protein